MTKDCLVITAADATYFHLVQGCIQSLRDKPEGEKLPVAFLDLGCSESQLSDLRTRVNFLRQPDWEFSFPGRETARGFLKGLLARPFLRRYFPGYETYLWLDADAWVLDWRAVELFQEGARRRRGLAIVPEIDRGSRLQYGGLPRYWSQVRSWYALGYGDETANRFCSYPMLNAGVFALHHEAPHWTAWEHSLREALQHTCTTITDQIALNLVVYGRGLLPQTELLPAWCNWTTHYGFPCWEEGHGRLVEPYLPHTPIGILHLTVKKLQQARLCTTAGDAIEFRLHYPPGPLRSSPPDTDYVSPDFVPIRLDRFFPDMVVGDKSRCPWPYLRRQIPHTWYVDRRAPGVGFLNRDEAHILYNTALRFRGRLALEIGCWLGWATCHLAHAGVNLDVIDPVLARDDYRAAVTDSLRAAGVLEAVNLLGGYSPQQVYDLAARCNRRWSLFFIDGNHEAPGPVQDAMACEAHAAQDALILFHDLASPDVAQGLDYLQDRGWHTRVYQTMQIMGAAWRGTVQPVDHSPDPGILWHLPAHLRRHPVSGWSPGRTSGATKSGRPPPGAG